MRFLEDLGRGTGANRGRAERRYEDIAILRLTCYLLGGGGETPTAGNEPRWAEPLCQAMGRRLTVELDDVDIGPA